MHMTTCDGEGKLTEKNMQKKCHSMFASHHYTDVLVIYFPVNAFNQYNRDEQQVRIRAVYYPPPLIYFHHC